MYDSTITFPYFEMFFLEILGKKISPPGWVYLPLPPGGSVALMYTKTIYDLIIAIINKHFEFQNDWLKIVRIRHNCMQFCSIPLC